MEDQEFNSLLARVRRGDATAAAELVKSCEPELRVIARSRLRDPRLRRVAESIDICQSVLGNFFIRAAAGQFELQGEADLVGLLARMIQNKVTDLARREYTQARDASRLAADGVDTVDPAGDADTPSQIVAAEELQARFRELLDPNDLHAIDERRNGKGWEQIAVRQGLSPEALRKRVQRAIDVAANKLDLERPRS